MQIKLDEKMLLKLYNLVSVIYYLWNDQPVKHVRTYHRLEGNWNLVNRAIASLSETALDCDVLSTAVTVGPDSLPLEIEK